MSEWQPIETAPKDGRRILIYDIKSRDFYLAFYGKHNHVPIYGWLWLTEKNGEECDSCEPTHWMSLPEPPK